MKDSWNPSQYEKFKNERSQPFFDLMEMVEKEDLQNVIDLGCGSGELTKILKDHFSIQKMIGIDSSASMLKKALPLEDGQLKFVQKDLQAFLEPGQYDLIFSNAALQWCGSHEQILKNLKDSLTTKGQIAIQMPCNHDYATHVVARDLAAKNPYAEALKSYDGKANGQYVLTPEAYASILYTLGFKRQRVYVNVYPHLLESRKAVVDWVKGTMLTYYQGGLAPELYEQFLKDYRDALFQVLPDQKPFFYPFKRIFIWASLRNRV